MDAANLAALLISIVAALGAWASSRASSKAAGKTAELNSQTTKDTAKTEAEKEAYDRARKMDVETIERQDKELKAVLEQNDLLRDQNAHLNADVKRIDADNRSLHDENRRVLEDNARLRAELRSMRIRLVRLERNISPNSDETVVERREDIPPWAEDESVARSESDQHVERSLSSTNSEPYLDLRGDADGYDQKDD